MDNWEQYLLAVLVLVPVWVYELTAGVRRYQVSGFRFYLIRHGLRAGAFLVLVLLSMWASLEFPDSPLPSIMTFTGVFMVLVLQDAWETRVQKSSPAQWNAWADTARQARQSGWRDRILLPRRIRRTDAPPPSLPDGRKVTNASELLELMPVQFPALPWFMIVGGAIVSLIAIVERSHPNPYIIPSTFLMGLAGIAQGFGLFFVSRRPQLSRWLMVVSLSIGLVALYFVLRTFIH